MSLAADVVADTRTSAELQWNRAGGHILRSSAALACASREAFVLLQTAAALDRTSAQLRRELTDLNTVEGATRPAVDEKRVVAKSSTSDDVSDGSEVQGSLVAANVKFGKRTLFIGAGEHRAPDGSLRLLTAQLLSPSECAQLVAGGLVAMASAFSRCGQTTLGISPALGTRMLVPSMANGTGSEVADASVAIPGAAALLYRAVERARRQVAASFGASLGQLRLSDATLTRLQPVGGNEDGGDGSETPSATASGALDVGLLRGDQFVYWRPHIDQVRVASVNLPSAEGALGARLALGLVERPFPLCIPALALADLDQV